jgi:hypothetical protein
MTARPGPRQSRPRWAANYGPERGTTYLIHFSRRYQHAGHYTGWTDKPVLVRFAEHLAGKGAVLTRAAVRAGIGLTLARTWSNTTKDREDSLKHQGGARRFCPECGVKPAVSRLASDQPAERLSLYELERLGTTSGGTPLPVTTYPSPATAPDKAAPKEEDPMFGRQKRAAARAEAARQAEADALFAEADRWADLAGEPPDFRQQITRERAARIMQQLGEPVTPGTKAQASGPVLSGDERDAEIGPPARSLPDVGTCCGHPAGRHAARGPVPGRAGLAGPGRHLCPPAAAADRGRLTWPDWA